MVIVEAPKSNVILELGMAITSAERELHGRAVIVPEMFVPGTPCLRTSVLALWADVLGGLLAASTVGRVPVTLELAVDLYRPLVDVREVCAVGRMVKAGSSVLFAGVEFSSGIGEPLAVATLSFMVARDPSLKLPDIANSVRNWHTGKQRLSGPFAERVGCSRTEPGTAVLQDSAESRNASRTINGGLIALAVEEATLSLAPGATLASLALRYLRPARVGPIVATADLHGELARVDVRDAGSADRQVVMGTARLCSTRP
jgi:acyl-coenzyme A thioesterase PaaI-like protein